VLVMRDGTAVRVARGGQRALLAALLLKAGRLVTTGELAEVLWGAEPPSTAGAALHNQVRRLRAALGPAGGQRICTEPGGYLIRVQPGELDLSRAEGLLAGAREAAGAGDWEQVSARAAAGLLLWRGQPLADVESDVLAHEVPRVTEIQLSLSELRLDAEIRLGRAAGAVSELRRLCTAHPLREHLHALLMLALHRCGRRAEALAAYQAARSVLIEELGSEPAAGLQQLHQQVLAGTGPAPPAARPQASAGRPVPDGTAGALPRQLPAPVRHFTGRQPELAALSALLDCDPAPTAPVISAIGGTAGVGKTALAVHWAHRVASRFPDGQLYVNLRGYDPDQRLSAARALAGFLRALGGPGEQIPPESDERAARYRSLLAGRRMLIVLDNARTVEQVRPLLPGDSACAVVVTSRDALAGLIARDGAARLELDLLPLEDALALLRELIGDRAAADPEATRRLAACCARLPLALRVAAELAHARATVPLAILASELEVEQDRLDLLSAGGDARTDVRAVFSWSYRHLDAAAARAFRLAGLHPGPDFEVCAAAALTGTTPARAARLLSQLARAHLIQPAASGRAGLHNLLRGYARELSAAQDSEEERRAALTRLFDYYQHGAGIAVSTLYPAERHPRPVTSRPASPVPPVTSRTSARAWLDAELASLIAVASHAADHDWPHHATRLSRTLFRHLDATGRFAEARIIHRHAVRAARLAADPAAEVTALIGLGLACVQQRRPQEADASYERALTLSRATGDADGQARALNYLAMRAVDRGSYQEAAGKLAQALAVFRSIGERSGAAHALSNLGVVRWRQGHYRVAADYQGQALALFGELNDQHAQSMVLSRLGLVNAQEGNYVQAERQLRQALTCFRELGSRSGEAEVLSRLGELFLATDRIADARASYTAALAICTEIGAPEAAEVRARLFALDAGLAGDAD
jgi:DNA-binding SARP family transcriptional activator